MEELTLLLLHECGWYRTIDIYYIEDADDGNWITGIEKARFFLCLCCYIHHL